MINLPEIEGPSGIVFENLATLKNRLGGFPKNDQNLIVKAYKAADKAHDGELRISKERYFEHLRAVALILIDECHITDASLIAAAFLHDTLEDTTYFMDFENRPFDRWQSIARERIAHDFNDEVADIVLAVTIPKADRTGFETDEQASAVYFNNLKLMLDNGNVKPIILKMADRLHNLRTQYYLSPERQKNKVKETRDKYLPLFEQAILLYPSGAYLSEQIKQELEKLESTF